MMFRLGTSALPLRPTSCVLRHYQTRFKSSSAPSIKQKALNVLLNNVDPNRYETTEKVVDARTSKIEYDPPAAKPKGEEEERVNNDQATTSTAEKTTAQMSAEHRKETKEPPPEFMTASTTTTPPPLRSEEAAAMMNLHEFAPKITVVGIGGAGGNALNNMIAKEALLGVEFLAMNTDAQHLSTTLTDHRLQLGKALTKGLGCGASPNAGRMAAEESREEIEWALEESHLVFITAGMGGGTGTGAAPVVAEICREKGILTVGVVTLPFVFEGTHRKRLALEGLESMQAGVDTLITIPNQNLFRLAGPKTTIVDAFQMADDVLLGGVKSITDLMTTPGLINLDFADVQAVMVGMGNALLGTGVASATTEEEEELTDPEQGRAVRAAKMALDNPLLGTDWDITTAKGMLVNITGGRDMTLYEVDKAAQCITDRIQDVNANIIFGSAFDERLEGSIRVSVVATGIEHHSNEPLYKY